MILIIQERKVVATATDEYDGPEDYIVSPDGFDHIRMTEYVYENGELMLPLPDPLSEEQRVANIWQAAHDYEYAQVSGSAIGLLAIGVMRGLPKCQAVQMWIKGVWTTYYERKASGSFDTDFSGSGPCPFSVPELMEELGL